MSDIMTQLADLRYRVTILEADALKKPIDEQLDGRDLLAAAALVALLPFKADTTEAAITQAYEIADQMLEESINGNDETILPPEAQPPTGTVGPGTEPA
jgi:hypothetical protein